MTSIICVLGPAVNTLYIECSVFLNRMWWPPFSLGVSSLTSIQSLAYYHSTERRVQARVDFDGTRTSLAVASPGGASVTVSLSHQGRQASTRISSIVSFDVYKQLDGRFPLYEMCLRSF
jgi:hypothetical protein